MLQSVLEGDPMMLTIDGVAYDIPVTVIVTGYEKLKGGFYGNCMCSVLEHGGRLGLGAHNLGDKPADLTCELWDGVTRLPPGHFLTFDLPELPARPPSSEHLLELVE